MLVYVKMKKKHVTVDISNIFTVVSFETYTDASFYYFKNAINDYIFLNYQLKCEAEKRALKNSYEILL